MDAINNIKFYSSYNYQTLTDEKLNQLSTDFYLPVQFGDVSIQWRSESTAIQLDNTSMMIDIYTVSGLVSLPVIHVSILHLPSVIQGDQPFTLMGDFQYQDQTTTVTYGGTLVPVIPASFFGGVLYTIVRYAKLFLEGALTTLGIALAGTIAGFFLALFIATGRILEIKPSDTKPWRWFKVMVKNLSGGYVLLFRGTPMIVQASFFWYGLGLFGDPLLCGLFVVSLNTAAYIAEIIRGGILAIDDGQKEAAKSLGMSDTLALVLVIFPQAIRHSMPAIGNEFVINIKDTAVLSVIGIFELFNQTRKIAGMHYRQLEAYFVVALIYLVLTYGVTTLLKYAERRLELPIQELPSSN